MSVVKKSHIIDKESPNSSLIYFNLLIKFTMEPYESKVMSLLNSLIRPAIRKAHSGSSLSWSEDKAITDL